MSLSWSSLRTRLIASYVAALVLALAAFGAAAVVVIDRDLHASLDERLRTTAQAALNFADVKNDVVQIDEHDRAQIFALLAPGMEVAVMGSARLVFSTTQRPAPELLAQARTGDGMGLVRLGQDKLRTVVFPIQSAGKRVGAVIAWASVQWIGDTDRQVAVAFAIAALLLAAVASLAGSSLAQRALDDTFARQRRFTTDAAHELRAPLSVIRAEADLALRKPRDIAAYQAALATIATETDQMEQLVSGLLVAARAQEQRGERTVVDPLSLAKDVCARLRPTADVKRVTIQIDEGQSQAFADAAALERAITAVMHNAIKHTPANGRIRVWTGRRGGICELHMLDSGAGFSDDALEHGLEWFWREDRSRTDDHATGLGLAIASSIAQASGGWVSLANPPGGGAQVTIGLPAR